MDAVMEQVDLAAQVAELRATLGLIAAIALPYNRDSSIDTHRLSQVRDVLREHGSGECVPVAAIRDLLAMLTDGQHRVVTSGFGMLPCGEYAQLGALKSSIIKWLDTVEVTK